MAIERAIEAAAPEITGIAVEGVAERPAERIITMDSLRRNAPEANGAMDEGHWASPVGFDARTAGDVTATEIDGEPVVVLRTGENLFAYRNVCPGCGSSWHDAGLAGQILACLTCGERFDVQLAGRGVDNSLLNLDALPLLIEHGVVQIAVPGAVA
jgi:nitrite reductase/ring-hydroxylating ferredoxin subunit